MDYYLLKEINQITNAKHAAIVSNQRRPSNGELVSNIEVTVAIVLDTLVVALKYVSFDMIKIKMK